MIIIQVYVDDILFGFKNGKLCEEFAAFMHKEFEMSMIGELNFFLGLQVKQDNKGILLNHNKYAKELVKKFNMGNHKESQVLMSANYKINKDEDGETVDQNTYRSMIVSFLYRMSSWHDIMSSVRLCALFKKFRKNDI